MDEIKIGDKVLINYGGFRFNGIVTSIDGNIIIGEITPHLKYFNAPKSVIHPIKKGGDNDTINKK